MSSTRLQFLALLSLLLLLCTNCRATAPQQSNSATSAVQTETLEPSLSTATLLPQWTATLDPNIPMAAPIASAADWSATPGWLTPPTLSPTVTDTATPVIIFDTPKPGQVQGARGTVSLSGGPAPESGGMPTPYASCCITILARDPVTQQILAQTQSGANGIYELQLSPGRYDVCTAAGYGTDYCINVIVTAGQFLGLDFGVAMP